LVTLIPTRESNVKNLPRHQQSIKLRNRAFTAFVLAPEAPVADWLAELDNWTKTAPDFFGGKPVVLDLAQVALSEAAIAHLVAELGQHRIRILGIEGVDAAKIGPHLPPVLTGGLRGEDRALEPAANGQPPKRREPASLMLQNPVRSGQTVTFLDGDITVLGSVASGAELVAGGSLHVYGTLRGRAMAGVNGNSHARIFCSRNEAELLAIDGHYQVAENISASLRSRPVQAWLEDDRVVIAALE
jgi:septum site-determining protein MinC